MTAKAVGTRRIVRKGASEFTIKSLTRDDGTKYHPHFDATTGEYWCDCADHQYRHRVCKHLKRALGVLERSGEIRTVRP
jgi:hypothetical protein